MAEAVVLSPSALPLSDQFPVQKLDEDSTFNPVNSDKKQEEFRNYENSARQKKVEEVYRVNHKYQTVEFVKEIHRTITCTKLKMTVWEAFQFLDQIVDDSDPDTNMTQLAHGLQTAEAARKAFPDEDWFHLTALLHDLGKVLAAPCYGLPQWAVVGDTFPVGCAFSESNVFPQFFKENADYNHPVYSTEIGMYKEKIGIMNLLMSYGHDEYMYQVLKKNNHKLPLPALYIIRFHSFYPWHKYGAYKQFETEEDREMLQWVLKFNQFDLYSKSHEVPNFDEVKDYYQGLIDKYIPGVLSW
jgi:inositol oxygenase